MSVPDEAQSVAAQKRTEVRAHLGTTGRYELAPLLEALDAGAGKSVFGLACLLGAPWMLAMVPEAIHAEVARSTGSGFGSYEAALLLGAGLGLVLFASLLRRDVPRRVVAVASSALAALLLGAIALSSSPVGVAPLVAGMVLVLSHGTVLSLVCDLYHPFVRVRALAIAIAGGVIGATLVPSVVAIGGGLGLSWRGSTLVLAALAAIGTVIGSRIPEAAAGALDERPARAVLRDDGGDTPADHEDRLPALSQALRMVLAPPSVRPLLLLTSAAGLLLGPMPAVLWLLLRDRWVVVETGRLLFVGAVLAIGAGSLLIARRLEVAWRAAPVRLLHQVTWTMALGGAALSIGAVAPHPLVAIVPFALGVAAGAHALLGAVVSMSRVLPAALRPLAAACTGVSVSLGVVMGDLVLGAFASRFGPAWGAIALGGLLLTLAAVGVRALRPLALDAEAAVDRVLDAERLASARRLGTHVPLLECRNVDFSYGQLQVLFDVSFSIDEGEMVALLGTNGAGKSTLLRVISGLGVPSRGSVALSGRDITFLPSDARVELGITQVPGGKAVFGSLSVVDNLRAFAYSLGRDTARIDAGIDETFDAFPRLAERRNQLAATLSGGEQQMLALGKALILDPRLLLIDELSLGLAPKIVEELLQMVERINREGTAIVLVEQSVNIALSLVDHAYFMEKGEVQFDGAAKTLLERPDLLRSVFLAEAGTTTAVSSSAASGGG